ncbi:hypothetical protein V8B55DRAFT_1007055 [Mucor lusitanicus]|uniref:Uncharacterized protein n=2 Tax=Mucor circinelloides f. lusitanicus TaxID=29924 RepID=A0A168K8A8_MUCCL|nr:hypothetical protein FB192DRAFT_1441853 [Mucor lusitanicus]OAD02105.1 hypothetical protein MUCCIDRAFT_164044 [Mucor lusitanicus CBS 277.49]
MTIVSDPHVNQFFSFFYLSFNIMFGNILTVTKTLFQQFELKSSANVFDPYQTDQFYEELNQDVYAGSNFDLCLSDEEDMVLVDKMADEKDASYVPDYCIGQPAVNRMQMMVATAAKGIIKKVSTGATSAYSTVHSRKKKLKKKAVDEELPVMRGYGVDFCPLFERPFDSNFCVDLSDRKNRCNGNAPLKDKYINISMKIFSSIETENDAWELV